MGMSDFEYVTAAPARNATARLVRQGSVIATGELMVELKVTTGQYANLMLVPINQAKVLVSQLSDALGVYEDYKGEDK